MAELKTNEKQRDTGPELLRIMALLRAARSVRHYLENQKGEKTSIDAYFSSLNGNKYLEDRIAERMENIKAKLLAGFTLSASFYNLDATAVEVAHLGGKP